MATTARAPSLTRALAHAAFSAASSLARRFSLSPVAPNWEARASVCERCALRVVRGGVSYCGKPFLQQVDRDPAVDGCGCPCREKAKAPEEHCPVDRRHAPREVAAGGCSCKWCAA